MDPFGLSLETCYLVGQSRALGESGETIDVSGALPDGTKFEGVKGLRTALVAHPEMFVGTFTEKLFTYALGRGLTYHDAPAIRSILHEAKRDNYPVQAIILGIVRSPQFQMRR